MCSGQPNISTSFLPKPSKMGTQSRKIRMRRNSGFNFHKGFRACREIHFGDPIFVIRGDSLGDMRLTNVDILGRCVMHCHIHDVHSSSRPRYWKESKEPKQCNNTTSPSSWQMWTRSTDLNGSSSSQAQIRKSPFLWPLHMFCSWLSPGYLVVGSSNAEHIVHINVLDSAGHPLLCLRDLFIFHSHVPALFMHLYTPSAQPEKQEMGRDPGGGVVPEERCTTFVDVSLISLCNGWASLKWVTRYRGVGVHVPLSVALPCPSLHLLCAILFLTYYLSISLYSLLLSLSLYVYMLWSYYLVQVWPFRGIIWSK